MGNGRHLEELMTVREVAGPLHVHPNTLRRWSSSGRIRAYRISARGDRRFRREEVIRFLAELGPVEDSTSMVR